MTATMVPRPRRRPHRIFIAGFISGGKSESAPKADIATRDDDYQPSFYLYEAFVEGCLFGSVDTDIGEPSAAACSFDPAGPLGLKERWTRQRIPYAYIAKKGTCRIPRDARGHVAACVSTVCGRI
jgi:hypothetical protein